MAGTPSCLRAQSDGWRTATDAQGNLRYRRLVEALDGSSPMPAARVSGDENWSPEFGGADLNNFNGDIHALATNGSDVIVGGMFTKIGKNGANRIARWDGQQWQPLSTGVNNGTNGVVLAIAISGNNVYVGGQFTRAGGFPVSNVAVWSLSTGQWTALGSGVGSSGEVAYVTSISVTGNNVYAGGNFTNAGGNGANNVAVWNTTSKTWSALGTGTSGEVSGLAIDKAGALYAGGSFIKAGDSTVNNFAKWDGASWRSLNQGVNGYINVVMFDPRLSRIYVGGRFSTAGGLSANSVAYWTGTGWVSLSSAFDDPTNKPGNGTVGIVRGLATIDSNVYVAGTITKVGPHDFEAGPVGVNFVARWFAPADTRGSNIAWESVGSGLNNGVGGYVNALASAGGILYVAGSFKSAGTESAVNVARWNGKAWSAFGSSAQGAVWSMTLAGDKIYVGGSFKDPNNGSAVSIARWEGYWVTINKSVNGKVYAVATIGTDVIVGGQFTAVGGISAINIARYNTLTDTWSAITNGSGVGGGGGIPYVSSLAVQGTDLIVAGQFTIADSVRVNNIARWNSVTGKWGSLGTGLNDVVITVHAADNGDIYAGGRFSNAGGVPASRIARFDGTSWSALGPGVNGDVTAIAARGNSVFAGGLFTKCGPDSIGYIARWDARAGSWDRLGGGVNNSFAPLINAIAIIGREVFVGGNFTTAGGAPASNIAVWNSTAYEWTTLGSGVGNIVRSIIIRNDSMYAGGDFTTAGAKASYYVGLWHRPASMVFDHPSASTRGVLGGSYPNPSDGRTSIQFSVPTSAAGAHLRMTISDALGRQIAVLLDGAREAGDHSVDWDARDLPDGLYFCRMQDGGGVRTRKIVLQRMR